MNTKTNAVNSNVETIDVNLDEIFNAAPSGTDITLPTEENTKNNILSGLNKKADFSFADPDVNDVEDVNDLIEKAESNEEAESNKEAIETSEKTTESIIKETESIIDSLGEEDREDENDVKKEKRGRKAIY